MRRSKSGMSGPALCAMFALLCGCQAMPEETSLGRLRSGLRQQAKLLATDKADGDGLGRWVAMSADGNTALIGAPSEDDDTNGATTDNGAAYIFTRSGETWTQTQKLIAADKANSDLFGISLALSADGNTALIGAYADDDTDAGLTDSGAAYIFTRNNGRFEQTQKLTAANLASSDLFGVSVALSPDGKLAFIAATGDDDEGGAGTQDNGAVYIFAETGGTFTQQQQLLASDRAGSENYGVAIATSANGHTVIVGANAEDDPSIPSVNNGAAYVYEFDGVKWQEQQKLLAQVRADGDTFGRSVAMSLDGNTALIGAPFQDDVNGSQTTDNGAAYIFTRSGTVWSEEAILLAPDRAVDDRFAVHVALSGDGNIAIVGARQHDDEEAIPTVNNGAAFMYARFGSGWLYQTKILASDKQNDHVFGWRVVLTPDAKQAIISAIGDDDSTNGQTTDNGAAYVYELGDIIGKSCTSDAMCLSNHCADGVCCDSACGDSVDDDCQACAGSLKQSGTDSGLCGAAKSTVVCRGAAGVCDVADFCDGTSMACPMDAKRQNGFICRSAAGPCDAAETCDGATDACPKLDAVKVVGTQCKAPGLNQTCDPADVCDGRTKLCPLRYGAPGLSCGGGKVCRVNGICG